MRPQQLVRESPGVVPVGICVAVFIWLGAKGILIGTVWLPATLLLLAVLAVCLVSLPLPRPPRPLLIAVALFAAYAAWSYLSILWADEQGVAWDGANRTVLYAIVFALCVLWPIRTGPAAVLAGAWGLGVAVVGLVLLLRVDASSNPDTFFRLARLEQPTDYANANVALWFSALWPCVTLAARREVPFPLRGLFLSASGLLAGLTILGQSRTWFFTLPLVLLLAVVLIPGRGRTLAALGAVGIGVATMLGPLIDLYDRWEEVGHVALVDDAARAVLLASLGLFVVGVVAGMIDGRVSVPQTTARRISGAAVAVTAVLALGGLGAFAASRDDPIGELRDSWKEFKASNTEPSDFGRSRFGGSLSNYRYDYWTVAWDNFKRHPVIGVGADNFELDYTQRGSTFATPRYAHSIELRVLSHTGLVGTLLLAGGLGLALYLAVPFSVRGSDLGPAVAGASVMVFAYWVVHGSVDWLWEFPALGAPAFGLLGVAAALAGRGSADPDAGVPRAAVAGGVIAMLVVSAGLTLPWLAERDLRHVLDTDAADPLGSLDRLDRAAKLNPLSPNFDKASGVILARQGRLDEAAHEFRDVLERSPRDSYAEFQLGVIASELDQPDEALGHVQRAAELAPRDLTIQSALKALKNGRRLDFERLDRRLTREIDIKLGRN